MIIQNVLDIVRSALKDEIHPKAVDFVYHLLHDYMDLCTKEKRPLESITTAKLVEDIPSLLVHVAGRMADLYTESAHITTYEEIGKILDAFVEYKLFTYGSEDKLNDFKKTNTIQQDIEEYLKNNEEVVQNAVENTFLYNNKVLNTKNNRPVYENTSSTD